MMNSRLHWTDFLSATLVFTLALSLCAGAAFAQGSADGAIDDEVAEDAADEAEPDEDKPWTIEMSLSSTVGQGTFVSPSNDTEWAGEIDDGSGAYNRWNLVYSFSPSYELGDFTFGANIAWVQWLTEAGGIRTLALSGGANRAREFRFQDPTFSVDWKSYTSERFGVTATPALSLRIAGDAMSRHDTFRAAPGASISLSRTFYDKLTLVAGLSGDRWFHEFTSPVVEIDTVGVDNVLYRPGEAEDIAPGRVAIDGRNIQYRLSPSIAASLVLPSDFSASLSYGLHNYWSYSADIDDELSPDHAITERRGISQTAASSISVSYDVNELVDTSLSFNTIQTPRTADQKSFRFPFWNFSNPASNSSAIQFTVTGTY